MKLGTSFSTDPTVISRWTSIPDFSKMNPYPSESTNLCICSQNALHDCAPMSFCILTGLYLSGKTVKLVSEIDGVVVEW